MVEKKTLKRETIIARNSILSRLADSISKLCVFPHSLHCYRNNDHDILYTNTWSARIRTMLYRVRFQVELWTPKCKSLNKQIFQKEYFIPHDKSIIFGMSIFLWVVYVTYGSARDRLVTFVSPIIWSKRTHIRRTSPSILVLTADKVSRNSYLDSSYRLFKPFSSERRLLVRKHVANTHLRSLIAPWQRLEQKM